VIHSLTAYIGQFGSIVTALFIYFFEGRMFSRCIVTKITSARGTVHSSKTRIPCGDQTHDLSTLEGTKMGIPGCYQGFHFTSIPS
jgi:hypothetical protein